MSLALGIVLAAGVASAADAQAVHACRQPDAFSGNLLRSLQHAASSMLLDAVVARDTLRLPTTTDVQAVTDASVCARAARSYSLALGVSETAPRTVYAIRVGTVYVVEDPDAKDGDARTGLILDGEFNVLKRYVWRERAAYAHTGQGAARVQQ